MNKKAVTLTEVLIAISIAIAISLPVFLMFSTSSKSLEKSSNLCFAGGLARYIIMGMMTMQLSKIENTPTEGIACYDESDKNLYFKTLFNFYNKDDDLSAGVTTMKASNTFDKLRARFIKYDFRYHIRVAKKDETNSVTVGITWIEFGINKIYESHAYIVSR